MRQRILTQNLRSWFALLLGWLASSLAIFVWVALNAYFGFTPIWLNVIVGALWIIWLANRLHPYQFNWTKRRATQILLWPSTIGLVLIGLLYALGDLFPEWFRPFRYWVEINPLTQVNRFANAWRQDHQFSEPTGFIPKRVETEFALGCALLGAWLLLVGFIISAILSRFGLALQMQLRQLARFLPKRFARPSHWHYHLEHLSLSGLMLITALLGSAAYANQTPLASSIYKEHERVRAPQFFLPVLALHSDAKSGALFAGVFGGVFRSTDGGSTWQAASTGLTDLYVKTLHSDAKSGALFAGTRDGVFRSTDGGSTWQATSTDLTDLYVKTLHSDAKSGVLFAGTGNGVFRSADGGSTWQAASAGLIRLEVNTLHSDAK
nr:hypothetical protein [Anaerolineae bacterium]